MAFFIHLSIWFGIGVTIIVFMIFAVLHGEPIHDLNAWRLEKNFHTKQITHPADSLLLEKKKYLGGKSTHGDPWCVYAVGEMRSSALAKHEIRETYRDTSISLWGERVPIKVLFADEHDGPYELPYVVWQDELILSTTTTDTSYIVYAGTEWPILFYDRRCDD